MTFKFMKRENGKNGFWWYILCALFIISCVGCIVVFYRNLKNEYAFKQQQKMLMEQIDNDYINEKQQQEEQDTEQEMMLKEYQNLYEQNNDFIGWLYIEGTDINYPVMQTPEDENYYLYRDFEKKENKNGCLILDTDSVAGVGTSENEYKDGTKPSTNLIIHGHTMKSGAMFGNLNYYKDKEYGLEHKKICFDSLYEKREYELIAVFYSQVYYESDDVFKYYKFFQAHTQEEFDDWYENIMKISLYDTEVSAEMGDEFITLSCCSYHVEDGRFVVVAKRIQY